MEAEVSWGDSRKHLAQEMNEGQVKKHPASMKKQPEGLKSTQSGRKEYQELPKKIDRTRKKYQAACTNFILLSMDSDDHVIHSDEYCFLQF